MFFVFDDFRDWAHAAGKPITTTDMTSAASIPPVFGTIGGTFQFNNGGVVIDDGDWFRFSSNPVLTAIAFSGFAIPGRTFGLCIFGMGRLDGAPLYMYSNTGFLGVVKKSSGTWMPEDIHAAPHCSVIITLMHFAL